MSFNKKKVWMAFSIWHTKMIPIACITQWISGTHSFELVIAFNPKLILPPKIGNKWLSRLSHLFFKLYFRFFDQNFVFFAHFSNYLEISKNLELFVSYIICHIKLFFHCVMPAIGSIFAWQKFIKTFFNRVLETKNVWAWYLNILCFHTK